MPRYTDITGQKFNKLLVLEYTDGRSGTNVIWKCLCDCGSIHYASSNSLRSGRVKSCGCLQKEVAVNNYKDVIGQTFGYLTALRYAGSAKKGGAVWECRCKCGTTITVRGNSLRNGHTKSCGCIKKEPSFQDLTGKTFSRLTVIKWTGEYYSDKSALWECICSCGKTHYTSSAQLVHKKSRSCGCLIKITNTTHGQSYTVGYQRAARAKRKQAKIQRTPPWADNEKIQRIYEECPDGYHVDHDIPLRGKLVSGLHTAANLRHIPASENLHKRNKFISYIEEKATGQRTYLPNDIS